MGIDKETRTLLQSLIEQSAPDSSLYKRLSPKGQKEFERLARKYGATVLKSAKSNNMRFSWNIATEDSGAKELLRNRPDLLEEWKTNQGVLNRSIDTVARQAVQTILDPSLGSIEDFHRHRSKTKRALPGQIQEGRQFHTSEEQPNNTGPRTLRRRGR